MYDVWEQKNRTTQINVNGNGTRKVRVAIYCRVSTKHDEQIKALQNQIEWCNGLFNQYDQWEYVNDSAFSSSKKDSNNIIQNGFFVDEGLSGLNIEKRPAFLRMIKLAHQGKIDLIVCREISRFSRNLSETTQLIIDLKERDTGVGIFFCQENLFTYDSLAEFNINLMTTLAQNESNKISSRVNAGIDITKSKHFLLGNGNIIGYNLKRTENNESNRYEIDKEQAQTVKMIFDLYEQGMGYSKISEVLIQRQRTNSSGIIKWNYQNIRKILHNKTYCGYVAYNVSVRDNYLSKKRHNTLPNEHEYHKVEESIVPPIISEEQFEKCQNIRNKKAPEFSSKTQSGYTRAKDVFARKLRCTCGCSFHRDLWHPGKRASVYGYRCYNQKNNGTASDYAKMGVDTKDYNLCDMPGFSEKKLLIQTKAVFDTVFNDDNKQACFIRANQLNETSKKQNDVTIQLESLEEKKEKFIKRFKNSAILLADGDITKDQYYEIIDETKNDIKDIDTQIDSLNAEQTSLINIDSYVDEIRNKLSHLLDFSQGIDDDLIEKFVYDIQVKSGTHFVWRLNFTGINENDNLNFVPYASFEIDLDTAKKTAKKLLNQTFHRNSWEDLHIDVVLAVKS